MNPYVKALHFADLIKDWDGEVAPEVYFRLYKRGFFGGETELSDQYFTIAFREAVKSNLWSLIQEAKENLQNQAYSALEKDCQDIEAVRSRFNLQSRNKS